MKVASAQAVEAEAVHVAPLHHHFQNLAKDLHDLFRVVLYLRVVDHFGLGLQVGRKDLADKSQLSGEYLRVRKRATYPFVFDFRVRREEPMVVKSGMKGRYKSV